MLLPHLPTRPRRAKRGSGVKAFSLLERTAKKLKPQELTASQLDAIVERSACTEQKGWVGVFTGPLTWKYAFKVNQNEIHLVTSGPLSYNNTIFVHGKPEIREVVKRTLFGLSYVQTRWANGNVVSVSVAKSRSRGEHTSAFNPNFSQAKFDGYTMDFNSPGKPGEPQHFTQKLVRYRLLPGKKEI